MVLLGVLVGMLITFPPSVALPPMQSAGIVTIGAIIGGFIGFKRRKSVGFFYFMLIAVLFLTTLLSRNLFSVQN